MTGGGAVLPIDEVLPQLREALCRGSRAVLLAPPGAGKTTRVPLALLDEPWLAGRRLLLLEPRRLAARAAARQLARQLGEEPGATVGWRMRQDTRVGPRTRLEVVTEGVLTRMLQADPALEGVGAVIFDEFHERSLQADVGLAFCLQSQALLREDLRLVVMSATLEAGPVAQLLGGAPVVASRGRLFPVATHYLGRPPLQQLEQATAAAVGRALREEQGDVLVFLPGVAEIRRAAAALQLQGLPPGTQVLPLHGLLSGTAQDEALAPAPRGGRKVVLATSIAETSLTVEGVRVVVDAGWMRRPRFSLRSGLTRLEMLHVTADAAAQRQGRAGRLARGACYRLWSEREQHLLAPRRAPEILESDLAALALELALWGVREPAELAWLDEPPPAAFAQGRSLLQQLGALDEAGRLTDHGRRLAKLGLAPRLGHMVLQAVPLGLGATACLMAVLLEERDVLPGGGSDLSLRLEAFAVPGRLAPSLRRRLQAAAAHCRRRAGVAPGEAVQAEACGALLVLAFPDRVAQGRGEGSFLLSSGRGGWLPKGEPLAHAAYLAAAEVDDGGREGRIFLAAPVSVEDLRRLLPAAIRREEEVAWDGQAQAVRGRRRECLGALVLSEAPLAPAAAQVLTALHAALRQEGLELLPWTQAARQWRLRLAFAHHWEPQLWPDVSEAALLARWEEWLAPFLAEVRDAAGLRRLDLRQALSLLVPWEAQRRLEEWAPAAVPVPSGRLLPVDYSEAAAPKLAVKLQEVFGWEETPRLAGGKVPLTLELLSPAQRPVQVTRDLGSFWREGYFAVRKELAGRYPKHYWPEKPLEAVATSRVRPQ